MPEKIPVARWSREYCKLNGFNVRRNMEDPTYPEHWNYLVKFSDNTWTFSVDGVHPNKYNILCFPSKLGYWTKKDILSSWWGIVFSGKLEPDEVLTEDQSNNNNICKCDSFQLFALGHNIDCPEKNKCHR